MVVGLEMGHSRYVDKKILDKNIADYTVRGYYFRPQLGGLLVQDQVGLLITGGLVFSFAEESLRPFIPGTYFGDFRGEEIRRKGIRAAGFETMFGIWVWPRQRFSLLLSSRLHVGYVLQVPENPPVDLLEVRYFPGLGLNLHARGEALASRLVIGGGFGLKGVFRFSGH
ncbi:MAG: hypothetical protein OHK0053_38410 [Microscillaceae bacterium]